MRSLRRTLRTAAVVGITTLFTTGCFKATLSDARFQHGAERDVWVDQYVFGLVGSPELDVREYCGAQPARVGLFENGWSFAVTLLTLGLYTPRVATIACAAPASSARPTRSSR